MIKQLQICALVGAIALWAVVFRMTAEAGPATVPEGAIVIEIKERKVVGNRTIRVKVGDKIHLHWISDEKAELHLHGYNIEFTVTPGRPKAMKFTANASGRFPVTSHGFGEGHGHSALIYLEVLPK